jgi:hypothetical protein
MKKIFEKLIGKKRTNTPKDFEWEKFQEMAKRQFKSLKDKGLSIPVMTI